MIDEYSSRHIPVIFLGPKDNAFKLFVCCQITLWNDYRNDLWNHNHRVLFNYIIIG